MARAGPYGDPKSLPNKAYRGRVVEEGGYVEAQCPEMPISRLSRRGGGEGRILSLGSSLRLSSSSSSSCSSPAKLGGEARQDFRSGGVEA